MNEFFSSLEVALSQPMIVMTIVIFAFVAVFATYIYYAIAWQTIAKRQGHKNPWIAWIPIANIALILQLGKFHWAWVFLLFIPIVGGIALVVLIVISKWRIYEKEHVAGWLSLLTLISIVDLILTGIVAWGVIGKEMRGTLEGIDKKE